MKVCTNYHRLYDSLVLVLEEQVEPVKLMPSIESWLNSFYEYFPLCKKFCLELVDTESLRFSVFYQISDDYSAKTLVISNQGFKEYLWVEDGRWCISDDFYGAFDVAKAVLKAPVFQNEPEYVKDLLKLFTSGLWHFSINDLPTFGGDRPEDLDEVLSWDKKCVLVGNRFENVDIVARKEWADICHRENNWYDQSNI